MIFISFSNKSLKYKHIYMDSREKTRLDRIEEKIDKMAEAVVSLARAEEKIVGLNTTTHAILKRFVEYESRMREVEQKAADSEIKLKSITAFIWTVITAIVAAVVSGIAWFNGGK
jgi:CHASE3 domain sensor protein